MIVKTLDENKIYKIGHAFGYYDYGTETGMVSLYSGREAVTDYVCGYVRMALAGNFLYATSEQGEGYIAYKLPGQKVSFKAAKPLIKALFRSMSLKELIRFFRVMSKGGPGLQKKMDKEKKPYIFVGLVCVCEKYQGQGYMRKAVELAFAEGNRLQVPVILETDAKSKCDKYMHLGMELAGTRSLGEYGMLYDLIKYPDPAVSESESHAAGVTL